MRDHDAELLGAVGHPDVDDAAVTAAGYPAAGHHRTERRRRKRFCPRAAVLQDMQVLLGIGGSEDSFTALQRVVERVTETGDDLTVAVLDNPASETSPEAVERRVREAVVDAGLSLADENGQNGVDEGNGRDVADENGTDVVDAGGAGGAGVSVRRLSDEPGPRLVELADTEEFDRIVLGGGQRSPMGKIAVGEIAEFVLVNARTSVLLVR
jgi:nucleotide-binding universal stress UspA family protein